jgi:cysteine-rich repeat protein
MFDDVRVRACPASEPAVTWAAEAEWGGVSTCGDSVVENFEQCDDGNGVQDDGCTSTCVIPKTCADYVNADPGLPDGEYTLRYEGNPDKPWTAYCHDMAGAATEYLVLDNVGGDFNFGQYTAGGFSPGTSVRTSYERLRIDPLTLEVDIDDRTFASSGGALTHGGNPVTEISYAIAISCNGDPVGAANINLLGTPFFVNQAFCQAGFLPVGQASVSDNGQVVNMFGGGECGWTSPEPCAGAPHTGITGIKLQLGMM